jgi:hypothetical protein
MLARLLLVSTLLAALPACEDDVAIASDPAALAASDDDAVRVADQGWNSTILGCSGFCVTRESFWIDLSVRNDAYAKEVAIVWSKDGWLSQETAYASFEKALPDGREQWGVDVVLGQYGYYLQRPPEVAYAAYVRVGGQTHWDRYNDHYIYQPVDAAHPVRLLGAQVRYLPGQGAVLSGAVRVYDLAFPKQVTIRYSTDGWLSSHDAEATWSRDDDWSFRIDGLGLAELPDEVAFAVRYRVAGQELWDSAGGADFHERLRPRFDFETPRGVGGGAAGGVVRASGAGSTDLNVANILLI